MEVRLNNTLLNSTYYQPDKSSEISYGPNSDISIDVDRDQEKEMSNIQREIVDKVMMDTEEMKNLLYLFSGASISMINESRDMTSSFDSLA